MTYYRVKKQYDNAPRFIIKEGRLFYDSALIGGELYTEKERARLGNPAKMFELVTVSPRKVYRSFGARFQFA